MVRGVGAVAISVLLVTACTTFGTMESPEENDDGGGAPTLPLPTAPFPPGTPRDGGPPFPQNDGGPVVPPTDGGPPRPDASSPQPEAGTGDRRIALVTLVAPSAAAMIAKCTYELGANFVPFVARDGMLPSAQYAPDTRKIVLFSNPNLTVAASLAALEANGAMTTILLKDGGTPSSGTHVWTGLGASPTAIGETCNNWVSTNGSGNGMAGIYNAVGRRTVYAEGKTCEVQNTLMLYCVER